MLFPAEKRCPVCGGELSFEECVDCGWPELPEDRVLPQVELEWWEGLDFSDPT